MTEKQVEAKVEEKVEDSEPTPYRNDYHKDLDKEDPQPDPEAVEAEATQKEEDKSFLSTSEDTEVKTHNFKKRYDDLKKHYDTKLDEWKQEKETLEAQSKAVKTDTDYKPPKTPEELDDKIIEMLNTDQPVIFDCLVDKQENCFPMIPSGKPHNQMLLGPKDQKEKKITGKGRTLV